MTARKCRLDQELVHRGWYATVDEAKRAIMAGLISNEHSKLTSPGMPVVPGSYLHKKRNKHERFVSRGGHKLDGALNDFGIDPAGMRCLDVGASTGGFTDCLLKRRATCVISVDVAYGQFDWSLRGDDRVILLERTNIVDVDGAAIACVAQDRAQKLGIDLETPQVDLIVADVSFTSLDRLLPNMMRLLDPHHGILCLLVKPQFEAAREDVAVGGVVHDVEVHRAVMKKNMEQIVKENSKVLDICRSKLKGPEGNQEFFIYATRDVAMLSPSHEALLTRLFD